VFDSYHGHRMTGAQGRPVLYQLLCFLHAFRTTFLISRNAHHFPHYFQLGLVIWSTTKQKFILSMAVSFQYVLPAFFCTEYRSGMRSRDGLETYPRTRLGLVQNELNCVWISGCRYIVHIPGIATQSRVVRVVWYICIYCIVNLLTSFHRTSLSIVHFCLCK